MAAPASDMAYYSLRDAVCTGDLVTVENLLSSDAGGVSDDAQREEILEYCFNSAQAANATDEEKVQMWYIVSQAWPETVRASASKLLQAAISTAPIEIFEELVQIIETTMDLKGRYSAFSGCEGYARTSEYESKRKAAFDRAVAPVAESNQTSAKDKKGKK